MEDPVAPPGGDKNTGLVQEAVGGLFTSIAFVLVILRFYVRTRMVKKLWWDDFFLLLGMLFSIAGFGLTIAMIKSGFGRHIYYLSDKQRSFAIKVEYIELVMLVLSLMFTKLSICFFLLRIFVTKRVWNNRAWKRAMYIIIALIVATSLSSAFSVLPQCKPFAKLWNSAIKGTCWLGRTRNAIGYYQGGTSTFTDFLLAFLPIYFLKDLQISNRNKLSICALMSLGVFTGICAVARTVLTAQMSLNDVTYLSTNFNIWGGLEKNIAIIAAAIPALRPLWTQSAMRNKKPRGQAQRPDDERRLNSIYVVTDQQMEADSLPSQSETRITVQEGKNQGDLGSEVLFVPDRHGILETSDVSMEEFRIVEGKWIPNHSSNSDGERSVADVV